MVRHLKRIENPRVRSLVRSCATYVFAMLVLMVSQLVSRSFPGSPRILQEYGVMVVVFYLGAMTLLLVYAVLFLFRADTRVPSLLPDRFIRAIRDLSQGVRNHLHDRPGDTATGRSARPCSSPRMTVKNHIYHIYRKTGVKQGSAAQYYKLTKMRLLDYCVQPRKMHNRIIK